MASSRARSRAALATPPGGGVKSCGSVFWYFHSTYSMKLTCARRATVSARLPASARRTYLLVEVEVDLAQVVAHLDHGQGLAAPLEEQVRLDRHARERRRVSMPRTLVARARARERYLELVELLDELVSGRGVLDELVGELEHLLEVAAEVQHEGTRATHAHTRNGAADAISSSPRRGPRRWRAGDTAGRSEPGP